MCTQATVSPVWATARLCPQLPELLTSWEHLQLFSGPGGKTGARTWIFHHPLHINYLNLRVAYLVPQTLGICVPPDYYSKLPNLSVTGTEVCFKSRWRLKMVHLSPPPSPAQRSHYRSPCTPMTVPHPCLTVKRRSLEVSDLSSNPCARLKKKYAVRLLSITVV